MVRPDAQRPAEFPAAPHERRERFMEPLQLALVLGIGVLAGGEPFFVRSANGCRITTADGRELIDYVGTWGPAILGHAPSVVIAAVQTTVPHPVPKSSRRALEARSTR